MKRFNLATQLSQELGKHLLSVYTHKQKEITKHGKDFVLAADLQAEKIALTQIKKHFPQDNILSEEEGGIAGSSDYKWIIDPLDGTANFKYHIPYFCASVSIEHQGQIISSSVYNPIELQLFTAQKNQGAHLNNEKIHVSTTKDFKTAFVSYSTSNHKDKEAVMLGSQLFQNILLNCRAIRLKGSSLLDLCNLACGNFDSLVKISGNYWDYAAGKLIVEEAGGQVTNFQGKQPKGTSHILATNTHLHPQFLELTNSL